MSCAEATVEQRLLGDHHRAWRHVLTALLSMLATIGVLSAGAVNAFAGQPGVEEKLVEELVYSTRAHLEIQISTGDAETEWRGEYSENSEAGPWIPAGSGGTVSFTVGVFPPIERFALGEMDVTSDSAQPRSILHYLKPSTQYYARFHVWNEEHKNEIVRTFSFETKPNAKPEIPLIQGTRKAFEASGLGGSGGNHATEAYAQAQIESNGSPTNYHFEYAVDGGPWKEAPGCSGAITVSEDFVEIGYSSSAASPKRPGCSIKGLTPETHYLIRLFASNEKGSIEETRSVTTGTAKPVISGQVLRNVTTSSARVQANIEPRGTRTTWRLEYATSALGPWLPIPGGSGTISQEEAEALPSTGTASGIETTLTGLSPSLTYDVRVEAENTVGEAQSCHFEKVEGTVETEERIEACAPASAMIGAPVVQSFETDGNPAANTFATHGLHGESLRLLGSVNPKSSPLVCEYAVAVEASSSSFTLSLGGLTTAPIASGASSDQVEKALVGAGIHLTVNGRVGGPYTVYCTSDLEQPAMIGSGASVVTVQQGGAGAHASGFFEYVSQREFEESGWAKAVATPTKDVGGGNEPNVTSEDLPALQVGETYHYRMAAESSPPGGPVSHGPEQSLTVSAPPAVEPVGECPNATLRSGPSANLPDCRGYEQITPVDKEGAPELYGYGGALQNGSLVGEDGEHVMVDAPTVTWGQGPEAGGSPYFFSHSIGNDSWLMSAAASQPETGVSLVTPMIYNASLTQFAFESSAETNNQLLAENGRSPNIVFGVGTPGASPYTEIASVPRGEVGSSNDSGWVASSKDFSKLILQLEDHTLLGSSTHTLSGHDLYEYTEGELHQVNVGIGTCGAGIVDGISEERGVASSAHAVSDDGSHVFFEAVPGKNCSQSSHLYVRVNGERTADIGAYRFLAANPQGTSALLQKGSEILLYNEAEGGVTPLSFSFAVGEGQSVVSEDFTALYFESKTALTDDALPTTGASSDATDLYRYDIVNKTLGFVAQIDANSGNSNLYVSANGRYAYFQADLVAGLPGGKGATESLVGGVDEAVQVYRYDSAEQVIECVSCASPSDPEPDVGAVLTSKVNAVGTIGPDNRIGAYPQIVVASSNGDYAFFDTAAALVPADGGTEVAPEGEGGEHRSEEFSVTSDVYEWRRDGINGCAHARGCLALITSGHGGYLNLVIGEADEGRDVFIYTDSQLGSSDDDTAGDIYDARIDGGSLPAPPQQPECVAGSCSNPFSAPSDLSPASATFHGPGNVTTGSDQAVPPKKTAVAKKKTKKAAKKKRKVKLRHRGKGARSRSKASRSTARMHSPRRVGGGK